MTETMALCQDRSKTGLGLGLGLNILVLFPSLVHNIHGRPLWTCATYIDYNVSQKLVVDIIQSRFVKIRSMRCSLTGE